MNNFPLDLLLLLEAIRPDHPYWLCRCICLGAFELSAASVRHRSPAQGCQREDDLGERSEQRIDRRLYLPADRTLPTLKNAACECRGCELYVDATQTVFGQGPGKATIMLVGEQPGDEEDRRGEPFVGPAGHVLNRALKDAGLIVARCSHQCGEAFSLCRASETPEASSPRPFTLPPADPGWRPK